MSPRTALPQEPLARGRVSSNVDGAAFCAPATAGNKSSCFSELLGSAEESTTETSASEPEDPAAEESDLGVKVVETLGCSGSPLPFSPLPPQNEVPTRPNSGNAPSASDVPDEATGQDISAGLAGSLAANTCASWKSLPAGFRASGAESPKPAAEIVAQTGRQLPDPTCGLSSAETTAPVSSAVLPAAASTGGQMQNAELQPVAAPTVDSANDEPASPRDPEVEHPKVSFQADGMGAAQPGRKMPLSAEQDKTAALPGRDLRQRHEPLASSAHAGSTADGGSGFSLGSLVTFPSFDEVVETPSVESPVHSAEAFIDKIRDAAIAFVRSDSEKVEVRIRPDSTTELSVEFARRDGQLEACLQVQRGDSLTLRQNWTELQKMLKEHGVHLLDFSSGFNTASHNDAESQSRYVPGSMAEADFTSTPAATRHTAKPAAFASRSQHRLLESWA